MVVSYPLSTAQYQQNGHAQSQPQFRPHSSMDSRPTPPEYPSATLPASSSYPGYPPAHIEQNGENSASTPQHQQPPPQDARSTYSSSATPTSETSAIYSSSRTPTFGPDQIIGAPRYVDRYQPASTPSGGMARTVSTSNSPSVKADPEVSEDSTVAAPSPAFSTPGHYGAQYPPGQHAMSESYQQHTGAPNQAWRPEWSPYGPTPHQMTSPYGHSPSPTTMAGSPNMVSTARPVSAQKPNRKRTGDPPTNHPLSQVYSFVPIPGATQNKRPRRRYEEIERMYKCGWNGCEKAYGTLNHLNAHVTMQGHGAKRTPDGKPTRAPSFFLAWFLLRRACMVCRAS